MKDERSLSFDAESFVEPDEETVAACKTTLETRRYDIMEMVGEGGWGQVFRARDRRLDRIVAIKRIAPEKQSHQQALVRFLNEGRTIAQLNHYNIVQVFDIDDDESGTFISMEFVQGKTLADLIKREAPLPIGRVLSIGRQLCSALEAAHAVGVIHRDVKPGNILLTEKGAPKLSDFGLAQTSADAVRRTATGMVVGTLSYASPEQLADSSTVDDRADVYSLAATLYEALTGESPRHIREDRLPEKLRTIFMRSLEPNRELRTKSAAAFGSAISRATIELIAAGDLAPGCPVCGQSRKPDASNCEICGLDLSVLGTACTGCGFENRAGLAFCGGCGANLREMEQTKAALSQALQLRQTGALKEALQLLPDNPSVPQVTSLRMDLQAELDDLRTGLSAGQALVRKRRFTEGRAHYQQLADRFPNDTDARCGLEECKQRISEEAIRKALEAATSAEEAGDFREAIASCTEILAIDPEHTDAIRLHRACINGRRRFIRESIRGGAAAYEREDFAQSRRLFARGLAQATGFSGDGTIARLREGLDMSRVLSVLTEIEALQDELDGLTLLIPLEGEITTERAMQLVAATQAKLEASISTRHQEQRQRLAAESKKRRREYINRRTVFLVSSVVVLLGLGGTVWHFGLQAWREHSWNKHYELTLRAIGTDGFTAESHRALPWAEFVPGGAAIMHGLRLQHDRLAQARQALNQGDIEQYLNLRPPTEQKAATTAYTRLLQHDCVEALGRELRSKQGRVPLAKLLQLEQRPKDIDRAVWDGALDALEAAAIDKYWEDVADVNKTLHLIQDELQLSDKDVANWSKRTNAILYEVIRSLKPEQLDSLDSLHELSRHLDQQTFTGTAQLLQKLLFELGLARDEWTLTRGLLKKVDAEAAIAREADKRFQESLENERFGHLASWAKKVKRHLNNGRAQAVLCTRGLKFVEEALGEDDAESLRWAELVGLLAMLESLNARDSLLMHTEEARRLLHSNTLRRDAVWETLLKRFDLEAPAIP